MEDNVYKDLLARGYKDYLNPSFPAQYILDQLMLAYKALAEVDEQTENDPVAAIIADDENFPRPIDKVKEIRRALDIGLKAAHDIYQQRRPA